MASGNISNAPVAPETIIASDGAYFDKIRVTWPKVPGATSYLIYRTESVNQPQDLNAFVAKTTALYYDDLDGSKYPRNNDGTVKKYWYWIVAKNSDIASAINKFNDGYLSSRGPITVTASTTYADGIVVSWAAVPGAISYDVYRDTVSKFTPAAVKVVSSSEALAYKDTSPVTGNYYYRVKAKYGSYESDFSAIAAMGRLGLLLSPSDVTALDNGATSSESGLREKGSYKYFSTNVPMGSTRLIATLCGTTSALTNDCNLFAKFANFPTVSSYNAKGVENKDNEILTVGNPAPGMWYFLLFGITAYDKVTLTVNCYSVADIVLTQVPVNDMSVPFTAVFKGKVVDEAGVGIAGLSIQVRNPIPGTTGWIPAKTDAKGLFAYSTVINTEGEYTFDFFFTAMPDTAKGTASHTVWTHKGFSVAEPNNFFDRSSYLPATQFPLVQDNVLGLQNFLSTRNGWDEDPIVPADETLWINSTLVKAKDDMQLLGKLDDGLYMFFYGVEGAGVGNDLTATSVFSAVPFVVHVDSGKLGNVLANLTNLIDPAVAVNVTNVNGGTGIVAVTAVNNPNEATEGCNISLSASEQLELLANIAGKTWELSDITNVSYSGVAAKKVTITLANDRQINVIASSFVK
jgi:intracellular sulfur oxidation DsrE/DsrF family protein